jgi:chitin synthase
MNFLSKVHYNLPMSPLELELYRQMRHIIGVEPSLYEYVMMIDADTVVMKDALNRMVAKMAKDARIIGLCGETKLANAKESLITWIQVYEYFISHHLSKAFESLFGTVTCLPGCFCMYRIRSNGRGQPYLISQAVLNDYAENNVNTLHLKNLLHLGEDRYLTTLMMKHFPSMKLIFTSDAKCITYCPDSWSVILSQRRRWINSTVHNLFELVNLPGMCGFCCFSMRFVVFIDLFATIVQPAGFLYLLVLFYMIYTGQYGQENFPLISIILVGAIYGVQVILFLLKREWDHIGWMVIVR